MSNLKTHFRNSFPARSYCITFLLTFIIIFSARSQSATGAITIEGEVAKRLKLDLEDLRGFKQTELRAKDHGGYERMFRGVALADLLAAAGTTLGNQLRGKNLLKYVVVRATDNYEVVFSLAEIDPEFTAQTILLAYETDGNPLEKGDGPFRMIVPNDKKYARWIREVTSIKVIVSKEQ